MHKPKTIQEDEMQNFIRDFEIQLDHLIPVRRSDLAIVNKKDTSRIVDFAVPADDREKIKKRKIETSTWTSSWN